MAGGGGGGGMNWEIGIDMYILMCIKWMANKNLLYKNKKEKTTYQILRDTTKANFREKFIPLKAYIKKEERIKINDLSFYFEKIEKEEEIKLKIS